MGIFRGRARVVAALLIAAAVAVSAWAGLERHKREQAYDTVDICLDFEDFSTIAARWPDGPEAYWAAMRGAGADSASVPEATLRWLEDAGYIEIIPIEAEGALTRSMITPKDPLAEAMLEGRLPSRLDSMVEKADGGFIVSGLTAEQLRAINIGPNDYMAEAVRNAGLSVVLKVSAFGGFDLGWVESALKEAIGDGAVVLFTEKTVGGYPNRLEEAAGALKAAGAVFGRIEFAKQLGSDELSELMYPNVAAIHSITPEELAKGMQMEIAADRFALAARERNMRLLYINPFRYAGEQSDVPQFNIDYVRAIAERLKSAGLASGSAALTPPTEGPDRRLLLASTAIGASAAAYLLLIGFIPRFALAFSAAAAALQLIVALALPDSIGRLLIPFVAAVAMPCLSALAWIRAMQGAKVEGALKPVWAWALASLISVSGGIMLASPAADAARMLGIGVFSGVKLAQVLPLGFALVAFWAVVMAMPRGRGIAGEARFLGMQPILWWQAAVVGAAGLVGLYMVMRSGNASPGMVSGAEEAIREALSKLLTIRPRNKEIFIGHPALICAGVLYAADQKALALAAFVLGMVGQVSMVNTFMHLHTPIYVTAVRTALGLGLGLGLGLAAMALLKGLLAFIRRKGLLP